MTLGGCQPLFCLPCPPPPSLQLHRTGREVATYTGCVPGLGTELALPAAPEAAAGLRTRLAEVVRGFCDGIRGQHCGQEGLGDILVALRLGPLAHGEVGLVVAAAAARWHPAMAAVQQAVAHLQSIQLQ